MKIRNESSVGYKRQLLELIPVLFSEFSSIVKEVEWISKGAPGLCVSDTCNIVTLVCDL